MYTMSHLDSSSNNVKNQNPRKGPVCVLLGVKMKSAWEMSVPGIDGWYLLFCHDVMNMLVLKICDRHFHRKSRKKQKNKIRPANAIFDGTVKPLVRGAVKNPNPRKGTETVLLLLPTFAGMLQWRTSIPVRGRKHLFHLLPITIFWPVKNHNLRKGTETGWIVRGLLCLRFGLEPQSP